MSETKIDRADLREIVRSIDDAEALVISQLAALRRRVATLAGDIRPPKVIEFTSPYIKKLPKPGRKK